MDKDKKQILRQGLDRLEFLRFIHESEHRTIFQGDDGTKYAKIRECHPVGRGHGFVIWELSPNGLTGFGYWPEENHFYEHLAEPKFTDDSHLAQIVKKIGFEGQCDYVWEVAHKLVGTYGIKDFSELYLGPMANRAGHSFLYVGDFTSEDKHQVIMHRARRELGEEESVPYVCKNYFSESTRWLSFASQKQHASFVSRAIERFWEILERESNAKKVGEIYEDRV